MILHSEYAALRQAYAALGETEPLSLLEKLAAAGDLTAPEYRHLRAEALHKLLSDARRALELCAMRNEIVVRPDGFFVDVGGVLMESSNAAIYLKSAGDRLANQGEKLALALARMNIGIGTVVDVGANFGEIALWFAGRFPAARIVAIEPSSTNVQVLRANVGAQRFSTRAVEIAQIAVSDREGSVEITRALGPMNRVLAESASGCETVACARLESILRELHVDAVDFMKVDIEGSEPAIAGSITALRGRVRSWYIEFSQFAPFDRYVDLADALLSAGYDCFDEEAAIPLSDVPAIHRHLRAIFAAGPLAVTNLWFVEGLRAS